MDKKPVAAGKSSFDLIDPRPSSRVRLSEEEAAAKIGRFGFRKTLGRELGEFTYLLIFRKT